MKTFKRSDALLSLCGLNCGLCSMQRSGHCGGCGFGNQPCRIAKCSLDHGSVEYCFQCGEYPCERYAHIDDYDSFITHQHQKADLEKAKRIGIDAYHQEQAAKIELAAWLLENFNDGRRKTLFLVAVNLLDLDVLETVKRQITSQLKLTEFTRKERADYVVRLLQQAAEEHHVLLKLRKK